jgi:hypothetical protein
MTRKTSLKVNNKVIELNPFVESFFYHVAAGMVTSLKDTGAIKTLTLEVLDSADVKLDLNGKDIPLNIFVTEIFFNTLAGMIKDLKGVDGKLKTLVLKITE